MKHLFSSNINLKEHKISIHNFLPYIIVSIIPFLTISLMSLLSHFQIIYFYPFLLTFRTCIFNMIAGAFFLFYVRHTATFTLSYYWQILVSTAYSLCSYAVLQEKSASILCVYAIFPLVFYAYEKMLQQKSSLPFILLLAFSLILSPKTIVPIALFLLVLSLVTLSLDERLHLGTFLHTIAVFLLSFILAAFRIFSYVAPFYTDHASYSYPGFSLIQDPTAFLARFLPGVSPAKMFFSYNDNVDLYFGCVFFIIFISFFFNKNIKGAKRLSYLLFTLLLFCAITLTPVKYIFDLCIYNPLPTISYSFFISFWCLYLACHSLSDAQASTVPAYSFSAGITVLILLLVYAGSRNNFKLSVFIAGCILLLFYYILLFIIQKYTSITKYAQIFMIVLVLAEFAGNIFVSGSKPFYVSEATPKTSDIINSFSSITDQSTKAPLQQSELSDSASDIASPISDSDFYTFINKHDDTKFTELYSVLSDSVDLSAKELLTYTNKQLPNYYETFNAYLKHIGYQKDFFTVSDITPRFEATDLYSITNAAEHIYSFRTSSKLSELEYYIAPFYLNTNTTDTASISYHMYIVCPFISCDISLNEILDDSKASCFIPFIGKNSLVSTNQILFYQYDKRDLEAVQQLVDAYCATLPEISLAKYDLSGLIVSFIGVLILFLLYFNSDKEKIHKKLAVLKQNLNDWPVPHKVYNHIHRNYIYYLSFFVPFFFFVISMIINNCTPFGSNMYFDSDGIHLTLPTYIDYYYNILSGNHSLTLNAGYGSSISATNPSLYLLFFYRFLNVDFLPALLLLGEAFCIGLSGLFMTCYMTHRLRRTRAHQKDYRLLISALIYSLNAYMLAMHSYPSWYFALCAFPLVMLFTDYVIEKRTCLPYILTLGFCMIMNLQLTMYMCIFLVILFFTYHFASVKDFFQKGFRFALCSLLAAGVGFYSIANTLLETTDSSYAEKDSIFPTPGLHTSFLEQWKKLMVFTYNDSVSKDNGNIALYFGIFALLLVLIYFISSRHSLKEKLCKLIPIVILCISFNGKVLSYLWDGFHYQSLVPNRYVFLLGFLVAELSYDGICSLKKIPLRRMIIASVVLFVFLCVCQFCSEGNSTFSFVATMTLCCIYLSLALAIRKQSFRQIAVPVLVILFSIEIFANLLYSTSSFALDAYVYQGENNYRERNQQLKDSLMSDGEFARICYPANATQNCGMFYNTPSTGLFNSFLSNHQRSLNKLYGFYNGINFLMANHTSTPFANMLCGNKYIFVHNSSSAALMDLDYYNYVGIFHNYYVFENPDILPLGFYTSDNILKYRKYIDQYLPFFYDNWVKTYTNDERNLFEIYPIEYSDNEEDVNSFYFTDRAGKKLSYEEASDLYSNNDDAVATPVYTLQIHINLKAENTGNAYLYTSEFSALDTVDKDGTYHFATDFPNDITSFSEEYSIVVMNEDVLDDFYRTASQNQLENITIKHDSISGTTNYENDGYTIFSLAYDRSWHAFIDGVEVAVEDPLNSCLMVKTPAGEHTLTLKYIPYKIKESKLISLFFLLFSLTLHFIFVLRSRKRASD